LFAIAAPLLAFYIFQVQDAARVSSNISALEQRLVQEKSEIQNLESAFSKSNSLAGMETSLSNLNYKKTDKVYYIHTSDTVVAYEPR